jgi:hypothetical protein
LADYREPIPDAEKSDADDPLVMEALRLVSEHQQKYVPEINRKHTIVNEAEEGAFDTTNPQTTAHKVGAFLMYVAVMKVLQMVKTQAWWFESVQADKEKLFLMKKGYESFLEKAQYNRVYLQGSRTMLETGDDFSSGGANEEFFTEGIGWPYSFRSVSAGDLFFSTSARHLRFPGNEFEARKMVRSWRGPWEIALAKYPWMKDGTAGQVPSYLENLNDPKLRRKYRQDYEKNREVQILEFLDLDRDGGTQAFIGGASALKSPVNKGEDYPYKDRFGVPQFNLTHRFCFETRQGIFKKGLYHSLYKLAINERILKNEGLNYQIINLNPVQIIFHAEEQKPTDLQDQIDLAKQAQANLKQGVIFAKSGQNVGARNLKTESIMGEVKDTIQQIYTDFAIWGVNLQDVLTDPAKTAFAIQVEGEGQTKLPRMVQNQNTIETENQLRMGIDWLIQNGDPTWDLRLRVQGEIMDRSNLDKAEKLEKEALETQDEIKRNQLLLLANDFRKRGQKKKEVRGVPVTDEFGEKRKVPFTIGDLVTAFKNTEDLEVVVDQDSGFVNSQTFKRIMAERTIARLTPFGISSSLISAIEQELRLNGSDIDLEDIKARLGQPAPEELAAALPGSPVTEEVLPTA